MSEIPPSYVHYPRNAASYGTADQLQSLVDSYYGFGRIFLLSFLGSFLVGGLSGVMSSVAGEGVGLIVAVAALLAFLVAIGFVSYRMAVKAAYGANWPSSRPIVIGVLMALNSVTCGIVGYVVMQQIIMNHIKRYGIRSGIFGFKISELAWAIAERMVNERAAEAASPQAG